MTIANNSRSESSNRAIVCRTCGVEYDPRVEHVHRLVRLVGRDVVRIRAALQDMLRAETAARGARMTLAKVVASVEGGDDVALDAAEVRGGALPLPRVVEAAAPMIDARTRDRVVAALRDSLEYFASREDCDDEGEGGRHANVEMNRAGQLRDALDAMGEGHE